PHQATAAGTEAVTADHFRPRQLYVPVLRLYYQGSDDRSRHPESAWREVGLGEPRLLLPQMQHEEERQAGPPGRHEATPHGAPPAVRALYQPDQISHGSQERDLAQLSARLCRPAGLTEIAAP